MTKKSQRSVTIINNQLSKNFHIREFVKSGGITIKPTKEQRYCLYLLANDILQPVREHFGQVKITSGLRNKESYDALLRKGYPASKTSDHFGWSDINPRGTGAADIFCPNATSMKDVFHWIIDNLYSDCKQIIYYPDMNVVHVSNSFDKIFTMEDTMSQDKKVLIKYKDKGFVPYKREGD